MRSVGGLTPAVLICNVLHSLFDAFIGLCLTPADDLEISCCSSIFMMSIINTSQPPATAVTMQHLYADVFRPLFFPAPVEFTQPLLEGFVDAHDELLENNSLFTHSTRSREIGVEVDGTIRDLRRREATTAGENPTQDGDRTSLSEVRKLRLRSRMQSVYLSPILGIAINR